jgi:drug/metabolite transporter superfamily protein YnfA
MRLFQVFIGMVIIMALYETNASWNRNETLKWQFTAVYWILGTVSLLVHNWISWSEQRRIYARHTATPAPANCR